ncbi:MAG: cache domain-containing protein [Thermodesulfobacteriota bacterium]|nr:cache domain-containing protein [Thermodesulfobacteriota bacterium]
MWFLNNILTLRTKLAFLFLVLVLVPLVVIGMFSINITETLIENLVVRQLENVAVDKVAILERWLAERKQDMQVIAGTSLVKSMEPGVIAPYLKLIETRYGVYNNIAVVAATGDVIFSTHFPASAIATNGLPTGKDCTLTMSSITHLPEQRESTFDLSVPIVDNGRCIGSVVGTVGTNKIITIILQVALGETGECYLVNSEGTFLAHKEPSRILTENISQSESFKNIFGRSFRKKTYLDYRNIEVLGASRKVEGTDWYIVVEQDREEAFQSIGTLKASIGITILLAISSALFLTWAISHHIVRPVRNLSRSAGQLARGEPDTAIDRPARRDEIGSLCRAFADMAEKIQERQELLEQQFNLKAAELEETDYTLKQFRLIAERSEKFAALGRLGAAVAHEIRTPLTSLKLFLESIQEDIEISPEYVEDFTVGMQQITRMEAAINRLLDYTKPKELTFSDIRLDTLIADILSMIRPLANKQECIVENRVPDDLPEILADKKLLEEALINIFINCLEALPKKGRITVTAGMAVCGTDSDTDCIRLDIKDSGPGISKDNIDFIFDPFFTTKSAGTGLGLPMVLNTIKRHNGEIHAKNRESGGAVFSLFFPVKTGHNTAYGNDTAN